MGNLVVSDNAATTLAASITNNPAVTSITLTSGAKFPVVNHGGSGSDWSYVTFFDAAGNIETMKVTRHDNGSGTLTVVRGTAAGISGVNDASCLAWASGTTGVACRLISQTVIDMFAALNNAQASASAALASAAAAEESAAASIPLMQKAAPSGVASLNASGKVVQKALNSDSADKLVTAAFSVEEVGGALVFKYGETNIFKIDSAGNVTVKANITGYGTP